MKKEINEILSRLNYSKNLSLNNLFKEDKSRFDNHHIALDGLMVDYSKNLFDKYTFSKLIEILTISQIQEKRDNMFIGKKINTTENRAVLHCALRNFSNDKTYFIDNVSIDDQVNKERKRIFKLVEDVHTGVWKGASGKKITDIVNIGIGGSDLGPKMVVNALNDFHLNHVTLHFISNVDGQDLDLLFKKIKPSDNFIYRRI